MENIDNQQKETLQEQLGRYLPFNPQEEKDVSEILRRLLLGEDIWTRENKAAHLTASAWVVSPDRNGILMCYHKLYRSWSWLGGHADGERDLLKTALREVREESGLKMVRPVLGDIYSVEILTVDGHEKHGEYISSHLHLNVTYLLEADPSEPLKIKEDENSGLAWFSPEEAVKASSEPWFRERIYSKLNEKLKQYPV
ncbi:MAG: NUDIX hydrolase [Blautia sp.]|nr:NUDIX hydrolase [Blautia sp.]